MSTKKKQKERKTDSAALKDSAEVTDRAVVKDSASSKDSAVVKDSAPSKVSAVVKDSASSKDSAPLKDSAGFKETLLKAIKKKQEDEAKQKESAAADAAAESGDKILFTGLDNSGKSSIILALQSKYSRIAILQPTRQIERTVFTYLGKQITRWDLGGQQRYRIAYLQNPSKYFQKTSICIFILDVQDMERVDDAIGYFKSVTDGFKELRITPPIYVFLHKADPEWMMIVDDLQENYLAPIKRKFQDLVGGTYKLVFKNTTIFEPWTIISAFSEILLQLYPKSEVVDRSIQEFAHKLNADGMVVMDNNALILGQWYLNDQEKEQFAEFTPNVLQLFANFRTVLKKNQKMGIILNQGEYLIRAVTDPLKSEERFIFLKAPLSGINDADIDEFGNVLIDLMRKK